MKAGFGIGLAAAAGSEFAASPALAAQPRSFTDVIDLTHPLYEGFPTFDGSKWFMKEPVFTYAKDKLNINRWTIDGTHRHSYGCAASFSELMVIASTYFR